MDGFNFLKALEPQRGDSLLFPQDFLDTDLIDLGRMEGWVDIRATHWIWTLGTPGMEVQCPNH